MMGARFEDRAMPLAQLREMPRPLRLFLLVLLALAGASVADGAIGYALRGRPALDYLWPYQPAVDFYIYNQRVPFLHSAAFFTGPAFAWMYPAPSIFFYLPFYSGIRDTHWWPNYLRFAGTAAGLDLLLAFGLWRAMRRRGLDGWKALVLVAGVAGLGWPFFFAFERGNIESLLWAGVATAVFCFAQGWVLPAALLLGFFGAAKLYPLLLFALFCRRGRWRGLVAGLATAALTTVIALRFLEPDVLDAYRRISAGVKLWTQLTTLQVWVAGVGPDHSLFGLMRQVTGGAIVRVPFALNVYLVTAGAAATALFLGRVRRLPLTNQVLFLVCAAILLPPTSFDYTLLLLLIPWAMVVLRCLEAAQNDEPWRAFTLPMLLFGVALAPLTFLHTYRGIQVYYEGPVRCVALIGLVVLAVRYPFAAAEEAGSSTELPPQTLVS